MPKSISKEEQNYLAAKEGLINLMPSSVKTQGQIIRDFGKLPPAYWTESQMSTPGPMKGGAPMYLGKQFTHGVMW